jgi:hypothetical protein
MERIATSKARKDFRKVVRQASLNGKRVKITHYGKTLVGIVSARDLKLLEDCEARRAAEEVGATKQARRRR